MALFLFGRQRKISFYKSVCGYVEKAVSVFDKFNEFVKCNVVAQYLRISDNEQLFSCTGQYDIQFPIYDLTVLFKNILGKEFKLIDLLHGKSVNNKITFTALIPFYGINGYLRQYRDIQFFYFFSDQCDLIAIRDDYSDTFRREMVGIHLINCSQ